MKNLFISVTFMFILLGSSFGQQQNPSLSNPEIDPNPYIEGESGTASVTFLNLIFPIPLDANNPMTLDITFGRIMPSSDPAITPPTGGAAGFFDWSITSNGNGTQTVQGVQNQDIPGFSALGEIIFNVNVTGLVGQPAGFNANLGGNLNDLNNNILDDDNVNVFIPIAPLVTLPVELLSFTGKMNSKVVELDWQTETEQNNAGFEVQKSADGNAWQTIGWVEGNGTSNERHQYQYIDKAPFIGDNYYRLHQLDFDGTYSYSNVIIVENLNAEAAINILPNPSFGKFAAIVQNPGVERMKITLFDSSGKALWQSELIEGQRIWQKDFDLEQKEMYFLSVQIGDQILTQKIVIINRA